jgi:brefeldin A-inhibited guanine nucleotide-exchange protein
MVLISSALEVISSSKESKRSFQLKDAVDKALNMVRSGQGGDRPREVFVRLRLRVWKRETDDC